MQETELRARFGSAVATYRRAKGLSQGKLAALVAVSRNEISLIERGEITRSLWVALRLAETLGARLEALAAQPGPSERELRVAEIVRSVPHKELDRAASLLAVAFGPPAEAAHRPYRRRRSP
jgi:DNA-binding XRE family transcriptional regulator